MKKEEINYERWLGQLKKTPPILENPEALTEDIMCAVKAASFRSPANADRILLPGVRHCCNFALGDMGSRNDVC